MRQLAIVLPFAVAACVRAAPPAEQPVPAPAPPPAAAPAEPSPDPDMAAIQSFLDRIEDDEDDRCATGACLGSMMRRTDPTEAWTRVSQAELGAGSEWHEPPPIPEDDIGTPPVHEICVDETGVVEHVRIRQPSRSESWDVALGRWLWFQSYQPVDVGVGPEAVCAEVQFERLVP